MKTKKPEQPELIEEPEAFVAPLPTTAPGKPPLPFKPGVDPVPVPFRVDQHPLYSSPQAAKVI
jgi:hypothetical protein